MVVNIFSDANLGYKRKTNEETFNRLNMTKFCIQIISSHPSKQTIVKKCRTEAGEKPKFADLLPTCLFFRSASSFRPDFSLIQRPAGTD